MSVLDNLAPDQRAVLQMVLQRGRSYDEIASLLSIDRAAVRQRALDAFDALAPVLPGPESALITDYLLRQLPERVAEQVYSYLQASDADREWAQAIAAVIAPLASGSLPEIPVGAPLGADPGPAGGLERDSDPPHTAEVEQPDRHEEVPPRGPEVPAPAPRPSSRRGGAILLGSLGAAIVAVVVVVALSSGGDHKHRGGASHTVASATNTTVAQNTGTTGTTGATGTTGTTGTTGATGTTGTSTGAGVQILAALNLTSPTGARSTLGVVQVVRAGGSVGIVLRAQGMPPNTAHNAYAVWLYNSASSYRFVGFVQYLVGKNGLIDTEGRLKPGAAAYHHLLITLETRQHPSSPGEVVLSGPFREHP